MHICQSLLERFAAAARHALPEEVCGLLIGQGDRVQDLILTKNVAADPLRGFEVDPTAHLAIQRQARMEGLTVIGVVHSHPHGPALPSEVDKAQAVQPDFFWLIYAVQNRQWGVWRHEGNGYFMERSLCITKPLPPDRKPL